MAPVHGKDAALLLDSRKLSAHLNNIEAAPELDLSDVTVFDSEGHSFIPGLEGGTVSLGGIWDNPGVVDTTVGMDAELEAKLQAANGSVVSVCPAGLVRGTGGAIILVARKTAYAVAAPIGEAVAFQSSWQSDGIIDKQGVSLRDVAEGAETSTGNEASVDNAASSLNGGAATLHVTDASGTTPSATIKVQHSVDNSVWVDLITFTAATTETAEWKEVAGTVNRYLRVTHTISGTTPSFTYAVVFARR